MDQTVTHELRRGSVGGPGSNDAECICGIGFSGFDTPAEAQAALDEHVADEARKLDGWAVLAAELTNIATDIAALTGSGLPVPNHFQLNVQPGAELDDETKVRCIDAMSQILLDRDGAPQLMSSGDTFYRSTGLRGPVSVDLYNSVTAEWVERNKHAAELAAMREQLATAEADAAKLRAELAKRDGGAIADQDTAAYAGAPGLVAYREYAPEGRTTAVAEAKPDTYGQALSNHGGYSAPGMPALHDQALAEDAERFPETHAPARDRMSDAEHDRLMDERVNP
jgi:hypothetical protein